VADVRRAELADTTRIVKQIERFNDEYYDVPINVAKVIDMVTWVIDDGVIFVSARGFIGGMVVDDLMRDWTVLQEFGWYAEDRSGIALLDAFIQAGRDLNVDEVRVSTLSTSSPSTDRLLHRKGFAPSETSHRLMGASQWPQSPQSSPSQP